MHRHTSTWKVGAMGWDVVLHWHLLLVLLRGLLRLLWWLLLWCCLL
jgi:hypothetical protein